VVASGIYGAASSVAFNGHVLCPGMGSTVTLSLHNCRLFARVNAMNEWKRRWWWTNGGVAMLFGLAHWWCVSSPMVAQHPGAWVINAQWVTVSHICLHMLIVSQGLPACTQPVLLGACQPALARWLAVCCPGYLAFLAQSQWVPASAQWHMLHSPSESVVHSASGAWGVSSQWVITSRACDILVTCWCPGLGPKMT
jgi:hypothetical protein